MAYDAILAKCNRTEKHLRELNDLLVKFHSTNPYLFQTVVDVEADTRTIRAKTTKIPPEIGVVISDALFGMRSTLDHLAYNLAFTKNPETKAKPYFPIEGTLKTYNSKAAKEVEACGKDAIDLINTLEPYQGGKGELLWHMHKANNFCKHNLLPVLTADITGHTILSPYIDEIMASLPCDYPRDRSRLEGLVITPKPGTVSTGRGGTELIIPRSRDERQIDVTVQIVFGQPDILLGREVGETLRNMSKAVLQVVKLFRDKNVLT